MAAAPRPPGVEIDVAVIGSGVRRSKLLVPGRLLAELPGAEVVDDLAGTARQLGTPTAAAEFTRRPARKPVPDELASQREVDNDTARKGLTCRSSVRDIAVLAVALLAFPLAMNITTIAASATGPSALPDLPAGGDTPATEPTVQPTSPGTPSG